MKNSNKSKKKHLSKIANIPTRYNGINFRSRLEARWAAFYDMISWKWIYEPFDMNGWIPDFLLNNELLVEIKPITKFYEPDLIIWDCDYPVMLSGIEPFNFGTMALLGWDKTGDFFALKEHNGIYGLSIFCDEWDDIFENINGNQFCYDYEYLVYLFRNAQNITQFKKVS